MSTLLTKYNEWVARQAELGTDLLTYTVPCCGAELKTTRPKKGERQWDSLHSCPHCETLSMKIVSHDKVTISLID